MISCKKRQKVTVDMCIIKVKKGAKMQTAKQEVSKLLSRLPEDCTFEDVQYHLYVLQKIERGLKDAKEGRVYSQEEVEKMMSKWLGK
jgi:predicted transcriptional regulator